MRADPYHQANGLTTYLTYLDETYPSDMMRSDVTRLERIRLLAGRIDPDELAVMDNDELLRRLKAA